MVGAWLKNVAGDLKAEISAIDLALESMRFGRGTSPVAVDPTRDSRFDALVQLIRILLRDSDRWRDDERLVVFTEYKTTLDYLVRRLRDRFEPDWLLTLFGGGQDGMDQPTEIS